MRLFFSKHELKLRRKRTIAAIICVVVVLGVYWILTRPQKAAPEMPTVIVEPVVKNDVEIYGEYVGRIRAQQFVEVRARVEGYLENMLFAEGTYVNKNQVLFVINQDQYRAKADKARAQLKKDEAQALKAERDLKRIRPLFEQNAASQLDLDNAEAAYESAEATVAMSEADLAQAYYELVALDTELGIVKQTLKAREEGVRLARIRFAGGLTSETSYRQAQVELARTATLVPDLERKISLKENDIAYLAGEYPNKIARSRLLQEFNSPETLPVGLPSTLLERRPDIRQAEQKLIAANAKVGVAYTNMFPRLALTGGFGSESTSLSELLKSPYAIMEGALLTPIFGWGKNRAALKAKKAAYEAEVHSYEKSVLEAFKETRNAIVNFNKIKEVYELRANLERSAKSYMDLAQLQYINGVINYLDVLDAQRGYFDAQIGLSNAIRDELIAVVQLYKALGGGWEQNP